MNTNTLKRNEYTVRMIRLMIPIVIQNLLSAAVSSADVVMLNYVGQSSISAVSLASNYPTLLMNVYYGLGTGATLLCAQYFGRKDMRAINTVAGIAMRFSVLVSVLMALAALLIPEYMMRVFTNDAELITIGAGYLRVMSVTFLCWGVTEVYLSVLRSMGRVTISMVLNVLAFSLNVVLNAVFIFGLFGAPKLGAMGVALATAISRLVEMLGCFMVSAASDDVKLRVQMLFVRNKLLFQDFLKMAMPALGNDVVWSLAFSMYSVILGHLGNDAVAANSLVVVVRNLSTVCCFAAANAGSILLGNVMGGGNLGEARRCASAMMRVTIVTGALGGLIVLAVSPLIRAFAADSLTETAAYYLKYMLYINSYYIVGIAVNTSLIAGIFRAGGDTRFGLVCDAIDMWCYAVPLGFLSAFVLRLPILWVYFLLCTDEFVKWPWVIRHYRSGAWIKNITRENLFEEKEA